MSALTARWLVLGALVIAALTATAALAACGGDDGESPSGNPVDRAFARSMIPHHESAVDMARLAVTEADHRALRALAREIIAGQTAEIRTLRRADAALEREGVETGDLGLDAALMGMDMDVHRLESAKPFDRAFIDMMVPHHQGAIRMSEIELRRGDSGELHRLAREITQAQRREIHQMKRWREGWYGSDSIPAVHGEPGGHGAHMPDR